MRIWILVLFFNIAASVRAVEWGQRLDAGPIDCGAHLHIASVESMPEWAEQPGDGRVLFRSDAALPLLVIGAGPGGLAAAAALRDRGIPYEQVEAHSDLGGLWNQTNPQSPAYDALVTNSSTATTYLEESPAGPADFLHHSQALEYLQSFAQRRNLKDVIQFGTRVLGVARTGSTRLVKMVKSGEEPISKWYRGVVVATGRHRKENASYPENWWSVLRSAGKDVIHASEYRNSERYKDKKVLVVGMGNSGSEIATELAPACSQVVLSVRSTPWIVPNRIGGKPADKFVLESPEWLPVWLERLLFRGVRRWLVGRIDDLGFDPIQTQLLDTLPTVDRGIVSALRSGKIDGRPDIFEVTQNGAVSFKDLPGHFEEFDAVIFATGYKNSYPFLTQTDYGASKEAQFLIFHPDDRTLTYLNEPTTLQGGWPLLYEQGQSVAAYYEAEADNRSHVDVFDGLRRAPLPNFKGHVLRAEPPNYVDARIYIRFLQEFQQWIGQ